MERIQHNAMEWNAIESKGRRLITLHFWTGMEEGDAAQPPSLAPHIRARGGARSAAAASAARAGEPKRT
jgi:hypothetical protein